MCSTSQGGERVLKSIKVLNVPVTLVILVKFGTYGHLMKLAVLILFDKSKMFSCKINCPAPEESGNPTGSEILKFWNSGNF